LKEVGYSAGVGITLYNMKDLIMFLPLLLFQMRFFIICHKNIRDEIKFWFQFFPIQNSNVVPQELSILNREPRSVQNHFFFGKVENKLTPEFDFFGALADKKKY
jgi:hypothetical protein